MRYTIAQDYSLPEIELHVGGTVEDGDLEPDLVAQLVSRGVLVSDRPAVVGIEEAPVEEVVDEQPVNRLFKRGKGR